MSAQGPRGGRHRERGKLSLSKCDFCRKDKQKCEPTTRVWPQKCVRCEARGLPCGPNSRKRTRVLNPEHSAALGFREPRRPADPFASTSSIRQALAPVSGSDGNPCPGLTVLSNAVSLYKLLRRAAAEADRQFEDLARIGESRDEITDCNGHIYTAAGKLRSRILEILSVRFQELSAQAPTNASNTEMQLLRALSASMLETKPLVGSRSRYRPEDPVGSEEEPQLSIRAVVVMMEMAGEVGAALLLHDESCEHSSGDSSDVVEKLVGETFRLQNRYRPIVQPLLETLRVKLPPRISVFDWHHRPLVFDNTHWMRLLEMPAYWRHQDCLGTTVLHFLIERLGSGSRDAAISVGSESRARFVAKVATQNFAKYETTDNYNRTPLHVAAQWNVIDVATALLTAHMDPDRVTSTRRTALHYAASLGHSDMCDTLLRHEADINAQTKGGNTPLMVALIRSDETYKVFLRHSDVKPEIRNSLGETALHIAVHQGHVAAVDELVSSFEEPEWINIENYEGETAVCVAAQLETHEDAAKLVSILLRSDDIDLSLGDRAGYTPLHYAAVGGNLGVCKLLATRIDGGLYVKSQIGAERASQLAKRKGHRVVSEFLHGLEYRVPRPTSWEQDDF